MVGHASTLDFIDQMRRLRQRAEGYRVAAATTTSPESRVAFLRLASDYDGLADRVEKLERERGPV
jgi:hypothetical protein